MMIIAKCNALIIILITTFTHLIKYLLEILDFDFIIQLATAKTVTAGKTIFQFL